MITGQKLGLYIHIPYCRQKCFYCNFLSYTDISSEDRYVEALISELSARKVNDEADSIYIGGGTPSALSRGKVAKIISALRENYFISNNCEITIEANPESCSESFISECMDAGINRFSLGLQSSNDELLRRIGRIHSKADFLRAYELLRGMGAGNISIDLIAGLPDETERNFDKTLDLVLALDPEHISLYGLKVEEATPLFDQGFNEDGDLEAQLYKNAVDKLGGIYSRYEVSNFCKTGRESRHNLKYWTLAPYIGAGLSAHSYYGGFRLVNTTDMETYLGGGFSESSYDARPDMEEEFIMLGLRLQAGISLSEYYRQFGKEFKAGREKAIEKFTALGALVQSDGRLRIADDYFYLMNSILSDLI